MTKSIPDPVITKSKSLSILADYPAYFQQVAASAVSQFGRLEDELQQDLSGQQRFYFPAAGQFFFKDPIFTRQGDLMCNVAFNGNIDDDVPNPDAAARIAQIPAAQYVPQPAPIPTRTG